MKRAMIGVATAWVLATALADAGEPHSYVPKEGFVPNEETASRIAEAVWIPIYGEENIRDQKPFHASLHQGKWTVTGTLPPGVAGGTAIAVISKKDGRILSVSHSK